MFGLLYWLVMSWKRYSVLMFRKRQSPNLVMLIKSRFIYFGDVFWLVILFWWCFWIDIFTCDVFESLIRGDVNSLTAIGAHEHQLFNKLRGTVVSRQILTSQKKIRFWPSTDVIDAASLVQIASNIGQAEVITRSTCYQTLWMNINSVRNYSTTKLVKKLALVSANRG